MRSTSPLVPKLTAENTVRSANENLSSRNNPAKASSFLQWLLFVIIVGTGCIRISATYGQLTQTFDEPAHIACGLELLDRGTYYYEPQHPPLARVMAALPLYIAGARSHRLPNMWEEGNAILHNGGKYQSNLELARLGTLPFFVAASVGVFILGKRIGGFPTGLSALGLFSVLPAVLAHGGLATTDMAATAGVIGTAVAFCYWLEAASAGRSLSLGIVLGLSLLTKFTVAPFVLVCALLILVLRTWQRDSETRQETQYKKAPAKRLVILVVFSALFVTWAGYGFSLRPITGAANRPHHLVDLMFPASGELHELANRVVESPMPLSEVVKGVAFVGYHLRDGHQSYLLGKTGNHGWLLYFPVAIFTKTPIPFLILLLAGSCFVGLKTIRTGYRWIEWVPVVSALGMIVICLPSSINIGLRHILPAFPFLAIVAAQGIMIPWQGRFLSLRPLIAGTITLGASMMYSSFAAGPEYLAYFNRFASTHPENVLVGSDLDWGQDLDSLSRWCRQNNVSQLSIAYFGSADLKRHGLPSMNDLPPFEKRAGIIAVSLTRMQMGFDNDGVTPAAGYGGYRWLDAYTPIAKIGASIRVFSLPQQAGFGGPETNIKGN